MPRDEVKNPKRAGAPARERCRVLRSVTLRGALRRASPLALASAGRRGREVGPMAEGWKALEGRRPRGHRLRNGPQPPARGTDSRKDQTSGAASRVDFHRSTRLERQERNGPERDRASCEGKALKAEPHERYRDEISPGGFGGRKPARACETLRPDRGGCGRPVTDGSPIPSSAVGAGSSGG